MVTSISFLQVQKHSDTWWQQFRLFMTASPFLHKRRCFNEAARRDPSHVQPKDGQPEYTTAVRPSQRSDKPGQPHEPSRHDERDRASGQHDQSHQTPHSTLASEASKKQPMHPPVHPKKAHHMDEQRSVSEHAGHHPQVQHAEKTSSQRKPRSTRAAPADSHQAPCSVLSCFASSHHFPGKAR